MARDPPAVASRMGTDDTDDTGGRRMVSLSGSKASHFQSAGAAGWKGSGKFPEWRIVPNVPSNSALDLRQKH